MDDRPAGAIVPKLVHGGNMMHQIVGNERPLVPPRAFQSVENLRPNTNQRLLPLNDATEKLKGALSGQGAAPVA